VVQSAEWSPESDTGAGLEAAALHFQYPGEIEVLGQVVAWL